MTRKQRIKEIKRLEAKLRTNKVRGVHHQSLEQKRLRRKLRKFRDRKVNHRKVKVVYRVIRNIEQKLCPHCQKWKPLDLYHSRSNKSEPRSFCILCTRRIHSKWRQKRKDLCFEHYGGYKCAWPGCDVTDKAMLTLDHINDDGTKIKKKLFPNRSIRKGGGGNYYRWLVTHNFPPKHKLQVLCWNHQAKKEEKRYEKEVKEREKNL